MKDLYTFDTDRESASRTYEEVNEIYEKFFKFIGVPFVKGNFSNVEPYFGAYLITDWDYYIILLIRPIWKIYFYSVEADAKEMGGDFSHEYHFVSPIGEEKLQTCLTCGKSSKDASDDQSDAPDSSACKDCQNGREVEKKLGIEVNFYFYENILRSKRIIKFHDF